MLFLFLFQSGINFFLVTIMVANSGLPGGDVGMVPILVLILVAAQFFIGGLFYFPCRKTIRTKGAVWLTLFLYWLFYEMMLIIVNGGFMYGDLIGTNKEIDKTVPTIFFLSSFFSLILAGLLYVLLDFISKKFRIENN